MVSAFSYFELESNQRWDTLAQQIKVSTSVLIEQIVELNLYLKADGPVNLYSIPKLIYTEW